MANLLQQFLSLVPGAPLLVGTVLSVGNNEAVIELPDGSRLRARGTAAMGSRVWVRDGLIEGTAPTLTVEVIEI